MKKLFLLFAAALMSASMFAQPATVPTVTDLANAGYDVTSARVNCLYFDRQVCNDIVWAGSNNEWSTTPVDMKNDGSFSGEYQSGDAEAWINMAQPGTKTATIGAGTPKHRYTITAYLPQFCDAIAAYADSVRVMGGFDNWTNGIWMEKKIDEDFNDCWYAEIIDVEEGTEFKLRFGTDADWAVQVQLNGQNLGNEKTGETTDIVLRYDGVGYGFAACGAPPTVDGTGITVNGRKYGFPVRLVKEVPAGVSGNGTEQYKNNSNPDWFSSK